MYAQKLAHWYSIHQRSLPWRTSRNPYAVWLSEVILQQTRVDQGLSYWERFMEKYPRVQDLAAAPEQEVLKLWQGLGYYSRARNLHRTAQLIANEHGGSFPQTAAQLGTLPGIGPYTAAAIASICFDEAVPVLDGNVFRLVSRLFMEAAPIDKASSRKVFETHAGQLLLTSEPGTSNQAMMELGSLVCTPREPDCPSCPLANLCLARQSGRTAEFPVKLGKTLIKEEFLHYFLIESKNGLLLTRRGVGGYWAGLYEPPLLKGSVAWSEREFREKAEAFLGLSENPPILLERTVHQLSHRKLHISLWRAEAPQLSGYRTVPRPELAGLPYPVVLARLLGKVLALPLAG